MKLLILYILSSIVVGCAGMNPNPGERTVDYAWLSGDYKKAVSIALPKAENGEPWAQLRMGIFYTNGWGEEINIDKAIFWYERVAVQSGDGKWEKGYIVGGFGKLGYFNQNSDSIIARHNLSDIYFNKEYGKRDLVKAYVLNESAIIDSDGKDIFFCCGFDGGRYFRQSQLQELRENIAIEMTDEELLKAEEIVQDNSL